MGELCRNLELPFYKLSLKKKMAETGLELKKKDKKGILEKEIFKKKVTCLNRLLEECWDCVEDYNPEHHPNNLDCSNYKEAVVHVFYVHPNSPNDNVYELNYREFR